MSTATSSARFELRAALSRSVSLGWDPQLDRTVVLKHVAADQASERISLLLAAPTHTNLAVARDDYFHDGARVLVMDLVEGTRIDQVQGAGREQYRAWIAQIGNALAHLHALDPPITHGDVKAANILVAGDRAVLVDVGLDDAMPGDDVAALAAVARDRLRRPRLRIAAAAVLVLVALVVSGLALTDSGARRYALAGERRTDAPSPRVPTAAQEVVAAESLTASGSDPAPPLAHPVAAPVPSTQPAMSAARPSRLGVYTPSEWFGQIDIHHLDRGPTPVLQRRNQELVMLWSHIATMEHGWLFFYREADGSMGSSPIEADGRLGYGDGWIPPQTGWTHVVGIGDNLVWFYRSDTGAARALRFKNGFHVDDDAHVGVVAPGYDEVVSLGGDRVLQYEATSGKGVILAVAPDGALRTIADVALPKGWSAAVTTGSGHLVGVTATGRADVIRVAGVDLSVVRTVELGGAAWTDAVSSDRGLVLYSVAGPALIIEFDAADSLVRATPWRVLPTAVLVTVD